MRQTLWLGGRWQHADTRPWMRWILSRGPCPPPKKKAAGGPVVATTMEQEPAGPVERGEAVTASGAAATAAFGKSAGQMSSERRFENVELGVIGKKKKVPRRVIHFVSGETMEEYSTDGDEVDGLERKDVLPTVDPTKLTWGPYLRFYMLRLLHQPFQCVTSSERRLRLFWVSAPQSTNMPLVSITG
ncbi:Protein FAM177A1 [Plecturocebus cupreus]